MMKDYSSYRNIKTVNNVTCLITKNCQLLFWYLMNCYKKLYDSCLICIENINSVNLYIVKYYHLSNWIFISTNFIQYDILYLRKVEFHLIHKCEWPLINQFMISASVNSFLFLIKPQFFVAHFYRWKLTQVFSVE